MKPDFAFLLDQAAWPAFLVDDSGTIRKANHHAVQILGTVMEGESTLSASVWAAENNQTAEEFLTRVDLSSAPMRVLQFRVKGGQTMPFNTFICASPREGRKFHLFQLFPVTVQQPAPPIHPVPPAEPSTATAPAASLAAQLAHKQKLDCAMQLIRTVALDFNNALTSILGHTSLVLSQVDPAHPWRDSLIEVEKSAGRAAEIAGDLADFSRQDKDESNQAPGNLNRVLRHAVALFQKPENVGIHWTFQLEKQLFTVTFDEAKMQQAMIRLLENAIEAVGSQGRITVRTLNHSFSEPVVSHTFQLAAGHYVGIEIIDSGTGIAPEVLTRIFEPFFTTKGSPHRGLGLAWVYGIVTNHGGTLAVNSLPGQGTTVRIFLSAQEKTVGDQPTQVEDLRGHETILYVDDEEMLQNLGQTVLSSFGYRVLTASSGAEALDIFDQLGHEIDLVVTDLVMPGMSGRELMDQLRRRAPALRILCTSGYLGRAVGREEEPYLRKPFTSQQLLQKVKQLLNLPPAS
jgi:two-component system, cell cycle sensor histidine kinase and response regulator CckA